ncbi:MAG: F0F1 ATP synthase subunit A [Candidatus Kerfeldbacteria bacterium]|nr:F0F1 ATP synthase subunit A [Candidatus Kerfeldbacteria bacterium]
MEISLAAETVFRIGSFPVTNTLIASVFTALVIGLLAFALGRRKPSLKPRGFQNLMEGIVAWLLGLMDGITGNRQLTKKMFPFVTTIFLFVVISNWIGIFPGFGTIGIREVHQGEEVLVPFFRSVNADLNFTLALAIVSVVATNVLGIVVLGAFKFAGKFFVNPFKNPIGAFVGLLELIGELAKLLSFSFRLFGNIFAGEVLLVVIASLIPYVAPLPFYFLEIFVGFIQAFVFAVLTLVFMRVATVEAEH